MCPLCQSQDNKLHYTDPAREWPYFLCQSCDLVFVAPGKRIPWEAEKKRYDEHNNTLEDPRYLEFIGTLVSVTKPYLKNGSIGLDFGCGVAAPVAHLLELEGFQMDRYDPYYFPKDSWNATYDFILATEVIEHLYKPNQTIDFIRSKTKHDGLIGFKSTWHHKDIDFSKWFYRNDDTHVVFYSHKTLHWIAEKWKLKILELTDREVLYQIL